MPGAAINNPLDTASGTTSGEHSFRKSIEIIASDPGIDAVVAILDAQSSLTDDEVRFEDEYFEDSQAAESSVPVIIASSSSLSIHPRRLAEKGDVPIIRGIRNALVAVRSAATKAEPADEERPFDLPDAETLAELRNMVESSAGAVTGKALQSLIDAYRLPFVKAAVVNDVESAIKWVRSVSYPIVLKIASPDIAHRSDIGGIITGITDDVGLARAWKQIQTSVLTHRPDARIMGMEVQEQLDNQIEAFTGFVTDRRIGSTIAVGLGGVLIELLNDAARAMAPVRTDTALRMISSTRLGRLMVGHRNLYGVTPMDELAALVRRLSWLAIDMGDRISELDLNPVMITPGSGRVRLIDALIVSRNARDIIDLGVDTLQA